MIKVAKIHNNMSVIKLISDKPHIIVKDKSGVNWAETIVCSNRIGKYREISDCEIIHALLIENHILKYRDDS